MRKHLFYGWIVLAASFVGMFIASGTRATFAVFIRPMSGEFGWSIAAISAAMSIFNLLYGLVQPLVGRLADGLGPKVVIIGGLLALGVAMGALTLTTSPWQLYLCYGLLAGFGFGASATVTNSALLTRWFITRRGLALSIATSGVSAGQMVLVPAIMAVVLALGWRFGFLVLAALLLAIALPLVLALVRSNPADMGLWPDGVAPRDNPSDSKVRITGVAAAEPAGARPATMLRTPVREAAGTRPFWLVLIAFFICGFGDVFFATHLVPFAIGAGIPEMAAAGALGIMGGFSFIGVLVSGALSDRVGRKNPLAALYLFRALALAALALSNSELTVYLTAAVVGMTYIAPGPLASALLADRYGSLSVGTLFGMAILSHQVGGALGAYLGGLIFDATASYYWSFVSAALLTFVAAGSAFSIHEQRLRPSTEGKSVPS